MPRPKYFLPTLNNLRIRDRGNNPHWEMPNAIYSITFRLHDSLPAEAMERLHLERKSREQRAVTSMERMHICRSFERERWTSTWIEATATARSPTRVSPEK